MESDLVKVNFRLPRKQYDAILKLVEEGEYESVSEFVREAVERLVIEHRNAIASR